MKSSANQRPSLLRAESAEKEDRDNKAIYNGHFVALAHALRSDQYIGLSNDGVSNFGNEEIMTSSAMPGLEGSSMMGMEGSSMMGLEGSAMTGLEGSVMMGLEGSAMMGLEG